MSNILFTSIPTQFQPQLGTYRIIILTVCGSNGDQSPLTSAVLSSASVKLPLSAHSSAPNPPFQAHPPHSIHTILIHSDKQPPQRLAIIRIPWRRRRRRWPTLLRNRRPPMISLGRWSMSVIRRRRAPDAISGVLPAAAIAIARVRARVLECAGRRAAFVACRTRRVVLAIVLALAGEVGAA